MSFQICYRCHEYHSDKATMCYFCVQDTLIDAEVPEEMTADVMEAITYMRRDTKSEVKVQ